MTLPRDILEDASATLELCRSAGRKVAAAESCTGGLIAAALTASAGSSDVFERGFVTYSNKAKSQMLGVEPALIERHGAVSGEVASAMASGALAHSAADLAVSVTGIAGPGGGTSQKPVGLVYIGWCRRGDIPRYERHVFAGNRDEVREASVKRALEVLQEALRARETA